MKTKERLAYVALGDILVIAGMVLGQFIFGPVYAQTDRITQDNLTDTNIHIMQTNIKLNQNGEETEGLNLIIGWSLVSIGILFVILAIPLLLGKIGMNDYYGMRISKAFESTENWYQINRYGAKQWIISSGLTILVGLISLLIPFSEYRFLIIPISLSPILLLIPFVVRTYRYANRL